MRHVGLLGNHRDRSPAVTAAGAMLRAIQGGTYADIAYRVRAKTQGRDSVPAVLWNCTMETRSKDVAKADRGIVPSGLIFLDFDNLESAPKTRDELVRDVPEVVAAWVSLGGSGVHALLCCDTGYRIDDYLVYWQRAAECAFEVAPCNEDPTCKNIDRLAYVSHDPQLAIKQAERVSKVSFNDEELEAWRDKRDRDRRAVIDRAASIEQLKAANPQAWNAERERFYRSCRASILSATPGQRHDSALRSIYAYAAAGFDPNDLADICYAAIPRDASEVDRMIAGALERIAS